MISEILEATENWLEAKKNVVEYAEVHECTVKEMYYPEETSAAGKEIKARRAFDEALNNHVDRRIKDALHGLAVRSVQQLARRDDDPA